MQEFQQEQKKAGQEEQVRQVGLLCPACGVENDQEAKYCSECGESLQPAGQCPKCGASILPGADICEVCGEWLLEGQCKFCYAPLEEGAKFCSECGNPVDGVACPQCGKLSIFDFCKHCGIPLTPQAHQMIKALQESEEFQSLLREVGSTPPTARSAPTDEELQVLEQWRQLKAQWSKGRQERQGFKLGDVKEIVERAQDVEPAQEVKPPASAMEKLQQRHFKTNQEARRFFGALKVLLPTIVRRPVGWRCVAFDCFHPDGPQGCADPSKGGEWIFEVESKIQEVQI
jgi:hypothetical protein